MSEKNRARDEEPGELSRREVVKLAVGAALASTATAAGFCGLGEAARSNARKLASMAERVAMTSELR